ncbi:MAG: type I methionyl aminopeptidase [Chthonomonas sp.]|nr:type I methionyl aminopeptidase [Chthonomonas sp.]
MIHLKSPEELDIMRESGRILARVLRTAGEMVAPGVTPLQIDGEIHRMITEAGGQPSFLGYNGFPNSACISVNEVVVHGIPTDVPLVEGDLIGLDLGVYINGFHTDAAWTFAVGKISPAHVKLMEVTEASLYAGIAQAKVGNKVGDISSVIEKMITKAGYGNVRELVGHGIGRSLHEEPSVPNYGIAGKGPVLKHGTTICIEPMINLGTHKVKTLPDNWTIVTADRKASVHFEHTIAVTKDGPLILTQE